MSKLNLDPHQFDLEAEDLVNSLLDKGLMGQDELAAVLIQAAVIAGIENDSIEEMQDYLDYFLEEGV